MNNIGLRLGKRTDWFESKYDYSFRIINKIITEIMYKSGLNSELVIKSFEYENNNLKLNIKGLLYKLPYNKLNKDDKINRDIKVEKELIEFNKLVSIIRFSHPKSKRTQILLKEISTFIEELLESTLILKSKRLDIKIDWILVSGLINSKMIGNYISRGMIVERRLLKLIINDRNRNKS